jgi:hypothetical protein
MQVTFDASHLIQCNDQTMFTAFWESILGKQLKMVDYNAPPIQRRKKRPAHEDCPAQDAAPLPAAPTVEERSYMNKMMLLGCVATMLSFGADKKGSTLIYH